ncbi:hypothetical protein MAR_021891, partial [Mya arenaria]
MMENMFIRRITVIIIFTIVTKCKGLVLLTSDQQYVPLYGQTTLTCKVEMDGVIEVNFKKGSIRLIYLSSCSIFDCQVSNATKYSVSKNTQPKGYDLFYLTISDFRETDSDDYHCEVQDNGESGSKFITHADPPGSPSCSVGSATITSSSINAIRGNTIVIYCSCDSNPAPSYSWSMTGVSSSTTGQNLEVIVQDSTTVTLTINNIMPFTSGSTERGMVESSFKVQVTAGFPNKTRIKWERISDMTSVSIGQELGIANIDRTQSGYYRCTASNLMEPTGGDAIVGNSSNIVYIDV